MADKTESKGELTRSEFADYLRELADEFDRGGEVGVRIGNKSVTLHPPDSFTHETAVVERSSILRGNKESLEIEAKWKTSKGKKKSEGSEPTEEEPAETTATETTETTDDDGFLGDDDDAGTGDDSGRF